MKKNAAPGMKVGNNLIEMKAGISSVRNLRAGLMQMAFHLVEAPLNEQRSLVLVEPGITKETLAKEWGLFCKTLQTKLLDRIHLIVFKNGEFLSFPSNLDPVFYSKMERQIKIGQEHVGTQMNRGASYFLIVKILIYQWLLKKGPTTVTWLADNAGCSYPTVAKILRGLGIQVERQSYRSIGLSQFPNEAFARLLINSDKDRSTARFADYSGQPFSPESYVRRLEKLNPPDLAIGGVLGARHYYPELDLVGSPRLDLSKHSPFNKRKDLDFIEKLDPALKPMDDPYKPANVVVHFVQHKESFFAAREGGLFWADPVECLLDLNELHLEAQAAEFLNVLQSRRQLESKR
jgi:hypothetical protein